VLAVTDEIVCDGSTTSRIDAVCVGDFLLLDREYVKKTAAAVTDVIRRTERHDHGITYSVLVVLPPNHQPVPGEHEVWRRFVSFGSVAAGGYFFETAAQVAAQDQDAIGAFVWRAMEAANPPLEGLQALRSEADACETRSNEVNRV
jgi:hypothetical protein